MSGLMLGGGGEKHSANCHPEGLRHLFLEEVEKARC